MILLSSKTVFKLFFAFSFLIIIINPIGVNSSQVLTTRNSVVDVKYTLYRDCQTMTSTDESKTWPERASNCQPVPNNIDNTLSYRYCGIGSNIPTDIKTQFPSADANLIEPFKTAMVGLPEGGFRSFMVPSAQGYGDGDLYFDITIVKIYNPEQQPNTGTSTNPVSNPSKSVTPPDNSLFIGLFMVIVLGSGGAFAFYKIQSPKVKTEEIISSSKVRETQKIKSLKDIIAKQDKNVGINKSLTKQKHPKTRRKRR